MLIERKSFDVKPDIYFSFLNRSNIGKSKFKVVNHVPISKYKNKAKVLFLILKNSKVKGIYD